MNQQTPLEDKSTEDDWPEDFSVQLKYPFKNKLYFILGLFLFLPALLIAIFSFEKNPKTATYLIIGFSLLNFLMLLALHFCQKSIDINYEGAFLKSWGKLKKLLRWDDVTDVLDPGMDLLLIGESDSDKIYIDSGLINYSLAREFIFSIWSKELPTQQRIRFHLGGLWLIFGVFVFLPGLIFVPALINRHLSAICFGSFMLVGIFACLRQIRRIDLNKHSIDITRAFGVETIKYSDMERVYEESIDLNNKGIKSGSMGRLTLKLINGKKYTFSFVSEGIHHLKTALQQKIDGI